MSTCIHGKPLHVPCLVCQAEAVRTAVRAAWIDPAKLNEALDRASIVGHLIPRKRGGARALAIVALRRIVDRAVSDEVSSLATADILRIALKALNQLED